MPGNVMTVNNKLQNKNSTAVMNEEDVHSKAVLYEKDYANILKPMKIDINIAHDRFGHIGEGALHAIISHEQ